MGLLLSVLVACVGVVELLAFYSNVNRALATTSATNVTEHNPTNTNDLLKRCASEKEINIQSEDIELEFSKNVSKRESDFPRKYLLTETQTNSKSHSRRFFVTNEVNENIESELLPNFTLEKKECDQNRRCNKFVVRGVNKPGRSSSPLPLPKKFTVTELNGESHYRKQDEEGNFRRSASPYPAPVHAGVPKISVSNELLDNPKASVLEVVKEFSKSPTPEKHDLLLQSAHRTTEFWTNKLPVIPSKSKRGSCSPNPKIKHRSAFHSPEKPYFCLRRKSKSISDLEVLFSGDFQINNTDEFVNTHDEHLLDSLDGVKRKKLTRNNAARKSRRRQLSSDHKGWIVLYIVLFCCD